MLNLFRRFAEWRQRERVLKEETYQRSRAVVQEWETKIKPLPIDEAKRRAEVLLADPTHFHCQTDPISQPEQRKMELLAPHLRAFFEMYSEVRHVHGTDEYLERALLWSKPVIMEYGKLSDQF